MAKGKFYCQKCCFGEKRRKLKLVKIKRFIHTHLNMKNGRNINNKVTKAYVESFSNSPCL